MRCKKYVIFMLITALLLTGCSMSTVDELYCLPRRSDEFSALQNCIDRAMSGLQYCAPRSGENQQTVQTADLDGDGEGEYLVFAKGNSNNPLKILIFDETENGFELITTLESNGSVFDLVEYVQMDDKPGLEMVVGHQLSDQVIRSVSVYAFAGGKSERLLKTNYAKLLTVDLDMDSYQEIFVLRPGQTESDNGIAELYGIQDGAMERTNEVSMSRPSDRLKRVVVGQLYSGETAVYAASTVDDEALITDVYCCAEQMLVNVSLSNESGTSVQTIRNYYVYADDIDNDGVVELPNLMNMQTVDGQKHSDRHELIRWYAMKSDGTEVDKMYTYHDFINGWYLELNQRLATRLSVLQNGNAYEFYLWSESYDHTDKILTIYIISGEEKEKFREKGNRFLLLKTDSAAYAADFEPAARSYGINRDSLIRDFHLIQQEWKTGEM